MCLLTNEQFPKKAWEDIIVYKILKVKDNILFSPWYDFNFELDKLYENDEVPKTDTYKTMQFVGAGFYHSYQTIKAAKAKVEEIQKYQPRSDFRIYKAVIPMGYQYYTGYQSPEYCSKAIKIIEECMN